MISRMLIQYAYSNFIGCSNIYVWRLAFFCVDDQRETNITIFVEFPVFRKLLGYIYKGKRF